MQPDSSFFFSVKLSTSSVGLDGKLVYLILNLETVEIVRTENESKVESQIRFS